MVSGAAIFLNSTGTVTNFASGVISGVTAGITASEPYREDNNRGRFHNAHTYTAQKKAHGWKRNGVIAARYCARRVVDGMLLDNIRQTLMEQVASQSIPEPEKDSA
ncbi:hypothetical protein [Granulibacter bethesdensis]|uniref:hypothetical protein n=1 Tax=Granulibacter bethesdensis TaxID=364410 RepID=UPI0003F1F9FA|nr:hypothetical protein [Granulibacter bethesdensis]